MKNIFSGIREKVSGSKNRYKVNGYNLDLTFVTTRIIAMAYPASGIEITYRNNINDVKFFIIAFNSKKLKLIYYFNKKLSFFFMFYNNICR